MKLLLINPRLPESFWNFSWAFRHIATDKRALLPPLGLATVAALTPPDWDVRILDENIEPIDPDIAADVVGVGGMAVQFPRQCLWLAHFRRRGCHVVAGGSYASLCPEEYQDRADTVVSGEAERLWPRFCADFTAGCPQPLYRETGPVELAASPVPRFDHLKLARYQSATIQFSRGCPYRCEFCDIIVTFGRKPRTKSLDQIERELDALRAAGVRSVFFVDDNLIGHRPRCQELLVFLIAYQRRHGHRFSFGAETSANVATQPDLLQLLKAAGFDWVFVGIETPDRPALIETRKEQNTRADLLSSVRAIYAAGIDVYASFIVGFDADDAGVFERQFRFLSDAGLVVASVALLLALPRTPLFERLEQVGRLRPTAGEPHQLWDNWIDTNVIPFQMSSNQLREGYFRLLARLADDPAIAARIRTKLDLLPTPRMPFALSPLQTLRYLVRFLIHGVLPGGPRRWWLIAWSLVPVLQRPRALPFAVMNWTLGLAIQSFIRKHLARYFARPRGEAGASRPARQPLVVAGRSLDS